MGTTVARGRKPTGEVGAEDWLGVALGKGAAEAPALVEGLGELGALDEGLLKGPDPNARRMLALEECGCPANPPKLGLHPAASPAAPAAAAPTSTAIPRTERRERRRIRSIAST